MKITIAAVGRLKSGPEQDLWDRYLDRAGKTGRNLGLTFELREIAEARASSADQRRVAEAKALLDLMPSGASLVALDEKGRNLTSPDFAQLLQRWRDDGTGQVMMAVGGADGLGRDLLKNATTRLAFGAMTWPHQIARIMLAEQLYRATTILSGHPYHRD